MKLPIDTTACPYCNAESRLRFTLPNFLRMGLVVLLHVAALPLELWLGGGEALTEPASKIPFARRCRKCGAYFKHGDPPLPHPICGRCGYNLTGNMRRVCPECGWQMPPERQFPLSRR